MNKRLDIKLEVVTPLSVGAGKDFDWVYGADYVTNKNKVYVLDLAKVVNMGISTEKLSELLSKADVKGICDLLDGKLEQSSRFVFELPAMSYNPIKTFLRSQLHDKPIIAGSSLKGAIRSVLFKHFRTNEKSCDEVLGAINDNTDFMRFIQVGDIEMQCTSLLNTKVFNLWREKENGIWHGGWKHAYKCTSQVFESSGFNTLYECVLPGAIGEGNIKFVDDAFASNLSNSQIRKRINYAKEKLVLMNGGIEKLFSIINNATFDYLQAERKFFKKYNEAEYSDKILDNIDYLLSLIPPQDDNSYCIMKMSAGSGFHSITGNWKYEDFTRTGFNNDKPVETPNYKSRKIVENKERLQLMGFVKLTAI